MKERLMIRKELSKIKNGIEQKSLIELKLQRYNDFNLKNMFLNPKFSILAEGMEDYFLLENVSKEFINSINKLIKEEKAIVLKNGYIKTGKNFFFKVFDTDNPLFDFIY